MKIAEIVCTFPPSPGGMGYVCFHNALELARLGHDVTVFTLDHGKANIEDPVQIKIERLKSPLVYGDGGIVPQLLYKLKGFDVLHLHFPFFGSAEYVCLASKIYSQKLFITYHMDVYGTTWLKKQIINIYEKSLLKWMLNSVNALSAPSRKFLKTSKAGNLVPWKKYIETGHGGVDTDLFQPMEKDGSLENKHNIKGKTVVLFVGNLLAFKGLHILIDAMSTIKNNNIILLVVGGGYEEERYRSQVSNLNLNKRVIFAGPQSPDKGLPLYYNLGDFLVLPSTHSESFGLVALEAMASGKPIIISDLPGPSKLVEEGNDGFLIPAGDAAGLKNKIEFFANNKEIAVHMGKAARQKVLTQYSWKVIAKKLEILFKGL